MTRLALPLLLVALAATPAAAQVTVSGQARGLTQAEVQALIPQPATNTPMAEVVGGQAGTAGFYSPWNHEHPRISRAADATTDAQGNWSVTWATPTTVAGAVWPIPINTGSQPVVCNVATRTTTGATGRCWLARALPATLTLLTNLLLYDVFGAPASNITVQVFSLPKTQ